MALQFAPTGGGMTLWNPTNEDMEMQYAGSSFIFAAGEKRPFDSNCANHILNSFGPRGITSLQYGDEAKEKTIGAEAIERNKDFKKKQVTLYNQQNENRKHMNLGYLPPTEMMKKYAKELGLKLLEPYAVRDEERAGIAQASVENAELKKKLEMQETEMAELKAMMKQFIAARQPEPEEAGPPEMQQVQDKPDRPSIRPGFKR